MVRKGLVGVLLGGALVAGSLGFYSCNQETEQAGQTIEKEYKKENTDALLKTAAKHYFQGDYELAKEDYSKYLEIKKDIKDSSGIAKGFQGFGVISQTQGDYNKAVEYNLSALKICENLKDSIKIAQISNNLGIISLNQEKYNKALEYFRKDSLITKSILLKNPNDTLLKKDFSATLNNIGIVFDKQNKNKKALKYYFSSLSIANEIGDENQKANCYNNIASVYREEGDLERAFNNYQKSLKINKELGDKESLMRNLINIGDVYIEKKNFSKSLEYLGKAFDMAKEINSPNLKDIFQTLSETYEAKGDINEALKYYKKFSKTKDFLLNEESLKQVAELETKYETEKKEKENELLRNKEELQEIKIKSQNRFMWGLTGAIGLASLLTFVSFGAYRSKKRAKEIIEKKSKEITDSIKYASNIQEAVLPREEDVKKVLGEDSFIFYKPKHIVSGDFYWMTEKNGRALFSACDCTGHGVPGAFMHMAINGFLNEAVNEKQLEKPNEIFDDVRNEIVNSLKSTGETGGQKDGMDSVLCSWDKEHDILEFACANNPLYLIRNNELIKYKGDKMCVGYGDELDPFKDIKIVLQEKDSIYILSDGYQDQFGGQRGKKFGPKKLRELLLEIQGEPMERQKEILEDKIEEWKGNLEQVDDILIMGVRV